MKETSIWQRDPSHCLHHCFDNVICHCQRSPTGMLLERKPTAEKKNQCCPAWSMKYLLSVCYLQQRQHLRSEGADGRSPQIRALQHVSWHSCAKTQVGEDISFQLQSCLNREMSFPGDRVSLNCGGNEGNSIHEVRKMNNLCQCRSVIQASVKNHSVSMNGGCQVLWIELHLPQIQGLSL